jgi:hypothetical protein
VVILIAPDFTAIMQESGAEELLREIRKQLEA